jgi:hypothetical protein
VTFNPMGHTGSNELWGVSCTSASACTAGGNGGDTQAWNGTSWRLEKTPAAVLYGVSCTAASTCTAVGYTENGSGETFALAEVWNGTAWSTETTPLPAGATSSELEGVSCTSATTCTAVGYYVDSAGTPLTLAESWNGTAWSVQAGPTSVGGLNGVSCTSASSCTAVGVYDSSTLAEAWDGTTWSVETTANPTGFASDFLEDVSCTATPACTAVGTSYNAAGNPGMLAEVWNGSAWVIEDTPTPKGATSSELNGVSCTAAGACTAVGEYSNSVGFLTLGMGIDQTGQTKVRKGRVRPTQTRRAQRLRTSFSTTTGHARVRPSL